MISFSKESWHYKLYVKMYGDWNNLPKSICPYFWKVVWALVWYCLSLPMLFLFVIGALVTTFMVPWLFLSMVTGHTYSNPLLGVPVYHWKALIFCLSVWSSVFGLGFLYHWFKYNYNSKTKEPSLVGQWIKSKKEKICPIIEFKEKE